MSPSDRSLPHDLEAERAVIGALLEGATLPDDVRLQADAFHRPDHRLVFAAIAALTAAGEPADALTVAARLEATGKLEQAGGKAALLEYADGTHFAHHLPGYARTVADLARRRELIHAALQVTNAAHDAESADDAIATATEAVFALATPGTHRRQTLAEAVARRIDDYRRPLETVPVPGSYIRLHLGDLAIIGGRPGTGKTAFALQCADVWRKTWPVLILSYEMSVAELADRMISRATGMVAEVGHAGISEYDHATYTAACADLLADDRLELVQAAGMPEIEVLQTIRRFAARGGRVVLLDYLQIATQTTRAGENADLTRFTRSLQQVAKTTGVLVLGLSQYNRDAVKDKPGLEALRGSGSLEQEAATVGLMWSPDADDQAARKAELRDQHRATIHDHKEDPRPLVRVTWAKVRHGRQGKDYFLFDGERMTFTPVDYEVPR